MRIFEGPEPLARAVAEATVEAAQASVRERGGFRLGVSGGTTPERLYRSLASDFRERIDWTRVIVCLADERAVPPEHPDSNFRMVHAALLGPLGVPDSQVRRPRGEADDLERAALEYEPALVEPLDFLILGVGADGHTASIFPGSPVTGERVRRVAAVFDSPKPPPRRITITPRVIDEARGVAVLATGAEKASAVVAALEGEASPSAIPASLVRERDWYLDRAAASRLAASAR